MTVLAAAKFNYRARIERAELLAQRYPSAQEILTLYTQIARAQRECYESLPKLAKGEAVVPNGAKPRSELDATILLEPFARFLNVVETKAPAPLAEHAREWSRRSKAARSQILVEFWRTGLTNPSGADQLTEFLARAFLQPYAEYFVGALPPPISTHIRCRCPRCDALPLLGVLRPEGDGGKRFLQCSFCSQGWEFRRIFCANCGEDKEQNLPVYVADQFPHVRVECCETCKHFLRTVDLTKDGHAVPAVDDLAAIPLTLWAQQNGYTRIQDNILGT
jgi:formate dehydrogenase accessory protein FdhE